MRKSVKSLLALSVALIVTVTAFNVGKIEANAAPTPITNNGVYYIRNVNSGKYMHSGGTTAGAN
ncbi:MAG: RICIN domain-containing protein, partial [Oscillospiraceae bacterium]|nr:RICIN domain-containing protein [Oscillospiraceae bacterium]